MCGRWNNKFPKILFMFLSPEPVNMLPYTTEKTLQMWLSILREEDDTGLSG